MSLSLKNIPTGISNAVEAVDNSTASGQIITLSNAQYWKDENGEIIPEIPAIIEPNDNFEILDLINGEIDPNDNTRVKYEISKRGISFLSRAFPETDDNVSADRYRQHSANSIIVPDHSRLTRALDEKI